MCDYRIDANAGGVEHSQLPSMQTNVAPSSREPTDTFTTGAKSLPQRYFVSPEIFAEEQKKIFSEQWVLVGHQNQIAQSGDYFISKVAGESLIVIRDKRSTIRAFYNVCRHRGTRLREDQSGHASAIQCPYHAWTYALDGRLVGAPHMDDVPGFDKSDYSLHPVHLGLWEGLIFVNLADSPTPLEEWFAPLAGKFSHWNLPLIERLLPFVIRMNPPTNGPSDRTFYPDSNVDNFESSGCTPGQ
jgi:phenylpropionate dioxygenase-like ring-hydroxylating dioxygenase large terminal subunit